MAAELPLGRTKAPITSSVQLLVEGNDQRNIYEAMVAHLKLPDIQVRNFGGVHELRRYLAAFVNVADFSTVRQLGIVRDAEASASSALESVQSALRNADLAAPVGTTALAPGEPNVGVLVLPDGADSGMLETLLCRTSAGAPVDRCIDEMFECVDAALSNGRKHPERRRCRAWLATRPEPHLSVGVAAKRATGIWTTSRSRVCRRSCVRSAVPETLPNRHGRGEASYLIGFRIRRPSSAARSRLGRIPTARLGFGSRVLGAA